MRKLERPAEILGVVLLVGIDECEVDRTCHARQRIERLAYATSYTVRLEQLPCWKDVSPEEYRRRIAERVAEIESQAALRRQLNDLPAKGPAPSSLKRLTQRPRR